MACQPMIYRILLLVGLAFIYLAVVFVIVGFSTNYWLEIRNGNRYVDDVEIHFGLHRVCWSDSDRCNNPTDSYDKQNFLPKVHGVLITGSILGLAASIIALVNFYREMLEMNLKWTTVAAVICAFVSGLFLMIGCILYAEEIEIVQGYTTTFDKHTFLGYSFGLTTCAGGMMWVGAILISFASWCGKAEPVEKVPAFSPGTPNSYGRKSLASGNNYPLGARSIISGTHGPRSVISGTHGPRSVTSGPRSVTSGPRRSPVPSNTSN